MEVLGVVGGLAFVLWIPVGQRGYELLKLAMCGFILLLFLRQYLFSTSPNPPYRPTYKRLKFTPSPAFGDDFIVGNLKTIVKSIEDDIFNSMDANVKENFPFHCVINPPRHGKSLLLDRLFLGKETEVLVIGVSYNTTTGLVQGEIENPMTAIKWFWIRVLKSMLQIPNELWTLSHLLLEPSEFSWSNIRSLIINGLASNPFLDSNGKEKNICFCIDEFSVLTDQLQNWNQEDQ
jgi:hypothetical protein